MENADIKYLKVLATQYPNIAAAATEIVNLKAILSLPKATEHFITDVHGEYEQFRHVMCNGSGAVQRKIEDEFGSSLGIPEKRTLATLIYYPELKIKQIEGKLTARENLEDWYKVTIFRLIRVCKNASSKYTRSKVRKSLPKDFAYIIEELMTGRPDVADQEAYYNEIINSVIHTGRAAQLIADFCYLIRRFTVDHLHVVGDIFDRGPYPHLIMDDLMKHHSVDIQWGNHDILWMGAAAGSVACMCNMLRISARYGNLSILEDAYGINMIPLMRLAMDCYQGHTSKTFNVHVRDDDEEYDRDFAELDAMMHKAITIIQFKAEGQLIKEHPEWDMQERLLLDKIDYENPIMKAQTRITEQQNISYVTAIKNGTVLGYKYFAIDSDAVAALGLELRGEFIGEIKICITDNCDVLLGRKKMCLRKDMWENVSIPVKFQKSGRYALYFIFEGDGNLDMKSLMFL